jgi:serine/threonine protein kinase
VSLSPGVRLGSYEILSLLGAGGMGEVYKARDTRLDRTVAIKILPESLASDAQFRDRFDREARAISQLTHPHICTLHDVGEDQGRAYFVMECLDGETLEHRLTKGALSLDDALKIAIQIADALSAAHRRGIIHRDLKPGNVMLTKQGAKLLDFGLAKNATSAGPSPALSLLPTTPPSLTVQGAILGTFQYMAPEQLEGQDADARTDIFAFGVVLYEMLAGKKPFEGKSHASLIAAIMHADPPPVSTIQPLTPASLDHLVRRCLAKDADARWQSMSDVLAELRWTAETAAVAATPAIVAKTSPAPRGSRVLPWVTASALAVGLVAALVNPWRAAAPPLVLRLDVTTPPTTEPFSFAISPDGRQLAFVANGEKTSQLFVRPLDQVTAQPLPATEGARDPFWSPDSRTVAFFADGKLKRIDLAGGAPQIIADAPNSRGGSWSRDGVIVFAAATTGGLKQLPATGGPISELPRPAAAISSRWPHFLPDGRHYLFTAMLGPVETRGLFVGSFDGRPPTRVLPLEGEVSYAAGRLLYVNQGVLLTRLFDPATATVTGEPASIAQMVGGDSVLGRAGFSVTDVGLLAYRSGSTARRQIAWVDRSGKVLDVVVPPEASALINLGLSPDASRVVFNRANNGNTDVWVKDLKSGIESRFTTDGAIDAQPIWSPDGSRIVFRSSRNGKYDLFEIPSNKSTDERSLWVTDQDKAALAWTPQGNFLLYATQDPKTASDLWVLPLEGERKPFPVAQTPADEVHGQISPDGHLLAYASNETGRYEVYVQTFPRAAAGRMQVSAGSGIYPRWSRDGRELYYVTLDNHLVAVPIQSSSDGAVIKPGTPTALFATRMAIGAIVGIAGALSMAQYAVAPDGRFLMLLDTEDTSRFPINIVTNWTATIPR